jgi:hypothetical protein
MKERGIIMQGESVLGILEGRKSQTRRVINPQPNHVNDNHKLVWKRTGQHWDEDNNLIQDGKWISCPYGQPGDRLWVRETWATEAMLDTAKPSNIAPGAQIWFRATKESWDESVVSDLYSRGKIRQSIFMPRWASRITLEIVNIRVERVQDISEEDAIAEGIGYLFSEKDCLTTVGLIGTTPIDHGYRNYLWHGDYGSYGGGNKQTDSWPYQYSGYKTATGSYSSLWEKINAKRGYSWDVNPYCWVIEFRVLK